jgi:ligand-binding sensor domain-containing protein
VPSTATWLTASTVFDTLKLSVAAPIASGTQTAVVTLYPQFAANAPLSITVNYTVTGHGTGPATTALWLGSSDGQMLEYTNLTTTNAAPAISGGTGGATGVGYLAVDADGNLWISSAFRKTVVEVPTVNFAGVTPTTSLTLVRPPDGNTVQPTGIAFDAAGTLWVADSANTGWFYGFTTADRAEGTPTASHIFDLTGVTTTTLNLGDTKFSGLAFDKGGNLWIADEGNALVFEMLAGQITGSNLQLDAFGYMAVGGSGGSHRRRCL